MLQDTDTSAKRWRNSAPVSHGQVDDSLRPLIGRLRQLGFEVPPLCGTQHNVAGGVPMQLAVRNLLQSGRGSGIASNAIRALLDEDTPLTLSLSDLGSEDAAIDTLQRFCDFLRVEIVKNNGDGEHIGICVHSHQLPLQAFQEITQSVPGNGPRYVLLDSLQMTQHSNPRVQSATDKNWSFLWCNRLAPVPLKPAYGATVRTACPLLADEVTASVLPVPGIQVPAGSAWLPISLPLPRFANDAGELGWDELLPALADAVGLAEIIMGKLCWSQPAQRTDAHLNRRLAMSITGLGDLVARRGLAPQNLATLRWLSAIVIRIRNTLWQLSGQLARNDGPLPALCDNDPCSSWHESAQREDWRHRWLVALEKSAVRHRNMLVLSPYSVLPSSAACSAGYTDLLPIIAYADAWSFADTPHFRGWNLHEYKVFHRRAWAVIQGCKTPSFVAAGV